MSTRHRRAASLLALRSAASRRSASAFSHAALTRASSSSLTTIPSNRGVAAPPRRYSNPTSAGAKSHGGLRLRAAFAARGSEMSAVPGGGTDAGPMRSTLPRALAPGTPSPRGTGAGTHGAVCHSPYSATSPRADIPEDAPGVS
jgi:hypothetical protein